MKKYIVTYPAAKKFYGVTSLAILICIYFSPTLLIWNISLWWLILVFPLMYFLYVLFLVKFERKTEGLTYYYPYMVSVVTVFMYKFPSPEKYRKKLRDKYTKEIKRYGLVRENSPLLVFENTLKIFYYFSCISIYNKESIPRFQPTKMKGGKIFHTSKPIFNRVPMMDDITDKYKKIWAEKIKK